MDARKVLVKENGETVISCPSCRKTKKLSVAQFKKNRKQEVRIRCCCSHVFCLCLEYRKYPRKNVKLLGKCINLSKHRVSQDIIIKNISLEGVGFCFFNRHRTKKDDQLQIIFELNDRNNTPMDMNATVRAADRDYIGCEFNTRESYRTTLGFYLFS